MPAPLVTRRKKKRKRSLLLTYRWLLPVLAGVGMIAWLATGPQWSRNRISEPPDRLMPGYIADIHIVSGEFQRFYGRTLDDPGVTQAFQQASRHVRAHDYSTAIGLLEQVSKVAAVPAVFNNLGLVYAEVNDRARAINAFRQALARDANYKAVRSNLDRLTDLIALGTGPVSRELESNNTVSQANAIAPGKPVDGDIEAAVNDVDFFSVTTPLSPRSNCHRDHLPVQHPPARA
jgi:tetratricopeptide (TPR) repeat protein